ncbi:Molecular chaperone (Small heat shock protein) [uncultured delta proteobacterium]|uniref:Molecular chaperone (Small heat shock protein) n=1 Tax=uncultured delta proteobacterium TaxID=34034 RepID=A0A212K7S8_9DELT|nr:Molecular chaperone (Small heat shock protein) [uncultured delta proteobacterium]
MNITKYYPSRWFSHEDDDRAPAVRRRGENPRDAFHSEVDRMFDDFFTGFGFSPMPSLLGRHGGGEALLKPSLDLAASDKEYTVAVELPGVDEKDIAVEVKRDTLTIRGEKKREFEDKDEKGVYRMERSYGSFYRTLALPGDADIDGIKAAFDKGVLRLIIPRTETEDTKKIAITNG